MVARPPTGAWRGTATPSDSDEDAGFVVDPERFERFSQVDDVFSRSMWDDDVRSEASERFYDSYRRPLTDWRSARGFRRRDYALRNAAWHVADVFAEARLDDDRRDGFLDPLSQLREASDERFEFDSPEAAAADLKQVATTLGADLVGITGHDERWVYTERFSATTNGGKPNPLEGVDQAIVIGQAMAPDLIATAPSALAGAAVGLGYSQDALVLLALAQYLRNLGYRAVPSMNDTALAIPLAVKAGLGEYARNGLLITPEYGPNVRLGKVFTDLPLAHDTPIRFGVAEMCDHCRACADGCPARAIPHGPPTDERFNRSNIAGVTKWTVDGEACFGYWTKINSDCAVCIRVCPYTRDYSDPANRAWLRRAAEDPLTALAEDAVSDRAARVSAETWWSGETPGRTD